MGGGQKKKYSHTCYCCMKGCDMQHVSKVVLSR